MYAVSTAALISILALASLLAVVVQAGDPRLTKCLVTEPISKTLSCDQLLWAYKTNKAELERMNGGLNCDKIIASGQVCVQGQFPICETKVAAGATDTKCDELASANQITKAQFIAYNDDVNAIDCSGVVAGRQYCVAAIDG